MTDIEGSTRRWEVAPSAMREAVETHDLIVRRIVTAHRGNLLKERGEGDSHFAIFKAAEDAVCCALELHDALQDCKWDGKELKVRAAIYTGSADLRDGDYYGPSVNRCARIRSAAHGGQTLVSETTERTLRNAKGARWQLRPLGSHRFRDLLEAERILQAERPDAPISFPPIRSLNVAESNLPIQLTSFIGRDNEVTEVLRLLRSRRLVTLTGAGGCGKTRLALQSAAELVGLLPDGVWFVELVGHNHPSSIPQTIAGTMGLSTEDEDPLPDLTKQLNEMDCLLVIDNCEHLLNSVAGIVHDLLRSCRKLRVLATSRERLAITGEHVLLVPPLACDLDGKDASLERVQALDSVRLLVDRAASRTSDKILTEDSAPDIARLCRSLDGIPLAIEQAAANLPYLTASQILDRLSEHLSILSLDEVDADPRHQTLQATLDWSYDMLEKRERALFQNLAVFVGGWTLEACESICSVFPLERKDVFSILQKLTGKSLVTTELTSWGARRYRLLEPIREYARNLGPLSPELSKRHLDWHSHLTKEAYVQGLEAENGRWLSVISDEQDNIRAALESALLDPQATDQALELCVHMHRFWLRRGLIREGVGWIERALARVGKDSVELQAQALTVLGALCWYQGRLHPAEQAFQRSLDLWKDLENDSKIAASYNNLGLIATQNRRFDQARSHLGAARTAFSRLDDRANLANTLQNLAVVEEIEHHFDAAANYYEEALRILLPDASLAAIVLCQQNLLGVYARQGELQKHLELLAACIASAIELADAVTSASVLDLAARFHVDRGDPERALRFLGTADRTLEAASVTLKEGQLEFRKPIMNAASQSVTINQAKNLLRQGRMVPSDRALRELLSDLETVSASSQ